ncbi:MAG: hypothetical protein WCS37_03120 [Chloroflexota bacterium]|nr:hypothetical protein [Chloroflexota bacterium]
MEQRNRQPQPPITSQAEKQEGNRTLLYAIVAMVGILLLGLLAGVIDSAINPGRSNAFIVNVQDLLLVIASTAPWIVFFFILCSIWVYFADKLFAKWNTSLNQPGEEAYGKGIIYEIVHDNNAAAAVVLIMPTLSIALALIYIAILNK